MTITILPVCCGCNEEIGVHRRDEGFYCDPCADDIVGISHDAGDDEDQYGQAPAGDAADRARDRWEEESLHD